MIKPMLARDHPKAFNDPNYIWETKYDGARVLAGVTGAGFKLQARSGTDKTATFPELKIRTKVPAKLDGEVVCYTNGKSQGEFNDIQRRVNRVNNISWAIDNYPATYEVFDVIEAEINGKLVDLRHNSLQTRKDILEALLIPTENVRLGHSTADGEALFAEAKAKLMEGVIGKHLNSHYLEGKREWLKVKVWQMGTFLVVGYTEGTGWRASTFGALVLSDMKGNYVGAVGTGFDDAEISKLCGRFIPASCPWTREPEPATWIKPFGVKIRYLEYTNDGQLRFPSYKGIV